MSLHKSLKSNSKLARMRNVMTRVERIEKLRMLGKWNEEEDSVFGLPKVKIQKIKAGKKKKKKKEEEGEEGVEAGTEATTEEST